MASDDPRRRLEELVASAGLCWAADRRQAALLLLEQAVSAAQEVADSLPEEGAPAHRLARTLRGRRRQERALAVLRAAFEGADLSLPRVFGRTSRALRQVAHAIRLRDPRVRRRRRILFSMGALFGVGVAIAIVMVILANVDRPEDRTFGGGGGRPFEVKCPPGMRVVGVDVFLQGTLVNGIRPFCLRPDAAAGTEPRPALMIGRQTDRREPLRCDPNMVAVGIAGRAGARVDRFTLLCGPADEPERETRELRGIGGSGGTYYRARCSEGSVSGFRGNAGAAVDSVGAICMEDDDS
jgi:hypothetical protein